MKKHSIFISVIIVLALVIGFWREHNLNQSSQFSAQSPLHIGTLLARSQKLPAFQLVDQDAKPFTHEALKNHWSLVFFGYAQCPDICPLTLQAMQQIQQQLKQLPQIQYIFVTIDPEHDTPTQLKELLAQEQYSHTPFIALTGDKANIESLLQTTGLHVQAADPSTGNIAHSGTLLLINPEGKLTAVFTTNDQPKLIAQDLKTVIHLYAKGEA